MTKKIEYTYGEVVGNNGAIFLEEVEPIYYKSSGSKRVAKFKCGYCGNEFTTLIESIRNNKIKSCGCQRATGAINRALDLTGQRFGRLVAKYPKSFVREGKRPLRKWLCHCDCGKEIFVDTNRLTSGHTKSCGCLISDASREYHTKDITGMRSGKLVARYNTGRQDSAGNYYWCCECDCGRHKEIKASLILSQAVLSCGCLVSRGENRISVLLDNIGISYHSQYTFHDCINPITKARLKFDFFLPDYYLCIEYDGSQHTRAESIWAKKEGLENIQYRDSIKDSFCKNNNIPLLRISYTDYDSLNEEYLLDLLNEYKKEV